ncbi:O-antigen ligase family protein [Roseobacter sp. HKCCD5988]|uniref:O-antigen ligase family protein n=1 Tax=Roseobacter sp. HKCCD5988 TaxID=3120338 RepID=UPI0030ED6DD1
MSTHIAIRNKILKICSPRLASGLELNLIAITLFVLPSYEAPKNIISILFLVVWLYRAYITKSIGVSSPFFWPIFFLAFILWISPLYSSEFFEVEWSSGGRWSLLALFVLAAGRLSYTSAHVNYLFSALMFGGVWAIYQSLYIMYVTGAPFPEMRSVGHVNHSSMYTLVVLAVGLGALFSRCRMLIVIGTISVAASLLFAPASKSIVGAISIALILLISVYLNFNRSNAHIKYTIFISVVAFLLIVFLAPWSVGIQDELINLIQTGDIFSGRDKIFRAALLVWGNHPLIGTGWFSFGPVTSEVAVQAELELLGEIYDPARYLHVPHGHNLFLTILIERGLFGVAILFLLLYRYLRFFVPIAKNNYDLPKLDRAVAISAVLVVVGFIVAGFGNTTMMNEHGHAGMAIVSIAGAYLDRRNSFARD